MIDVRKEKGDVAIGAEVRGLLVRERESTGAAGLLRLARTRRVRWARPSRHGRFEAAGLFFVLQPSFLQIAIVFEIQNKKGSNKFVKFCKFKVQPNKFEATKNF